MTFEIDRNDLGDADLDRRLAALVRESDPAPTAWASIERRIEHPIERPIDSPLPRRWAARWAAVAAVAMAAIVTVLWTQNDSAVPIDSMRTLVQAEVEAMRRSAPVATVAMVDEPPWTQAWTDNQAAIDQLEAAVERNPGNRLLLEFLAEARLRQARLINSGLAHFPPTRMTL